MLPEQLNYPHFVPDQLLTSDHLNRLFEYVEEQERLTRTNLIGAGIVCGLDVSVSPNGSEISITNGCGVTSAGYLVVFGESQNGKKVTYNRYKKFNSVQDKIYDKFVDGAMQERFNLDELKHESFDDAIPFPEGYFSDKVVLLYVELLEEGAKNCNPNSCDDKGVMVTVTFRPLVVHKDNASALLATENIAENYLHLPKLKLQRFDVPNHEPITTEDIFDAYKNILNASFINSLEKTLSSVYTIFSQAIIDEFPLDPFAGFASKYVFLQQAGINTKDLTYIQYFYDFFSDILQAYDEFRNAAVSLSSKCCIDGSLFPRHLLLGETYIGNDEKPQFRHHFISSPLFNQRSLYEKLKVLFKRLVKLIEEFDLPNPASPPNSAVDDKIKITPSLLSSAPLSHKSIPFYYRSNTNPNPLFKLWDFEKTETGRAEEILSYNAADYTSDNFTLEPLKYDLEPYNFLRVEGHIGKSYTHVLSNLQRIIYTNRLPVEVIALRTGDINEATFIDSEQECILTDIELSYDISRREWEAVIGKTIEYFNLNQNKIKQSFSGDIPRLIVELIKKMQLAKTYMVNSVSLFVTKYRQFIPLYEDIEKRATDLRTAISNAVRPSSPAFSEDVIDHLDDVLLSCEKGPFRALYQEYSRRLGDIYAKLYFGPYLEKNPGIQHKAGVPLGGTFIVVYHQRSRRKGFIPRGNATGLDRGDVDRANTGRPADRLEDFRTAGSSRFVLGRNEIERIPSRSINKYVEGNLRTASGEPVIGATLKLQGSPRSVTTDSSGAFTIYAQVFPTRFTVSVYGQRDKDIFINDEEDLKDIVLSPRDEIDDSDAIDKLQDGIVIADFYLPYSCRSDCTPIQFIVNGPQANKPPVARSGEDITLTLPTNTVTADGTSSSDPDGIVQKYVWAYKSGPDTFKIDNPEAAKTTIGSLTEGEYIFTLTVTDDSGLVNTDEVKITVVPAPNRAPTARAGDDQTIVVPANSLTLDGSLSTDTDGTIVSYRWAYISGPEGYHLATPDAAVTIVEKLIEGVYLFELTVTDDDGAIGKDTVTITVQPEPNEPPVAHAGDDITIIRPENFVTLDGSRSSDPDGEIVKYSWKQLSGPVPGSIVNGEQVTTGVGKLADEGIYVFELTVTDDKGATDTDTVTVTVQAPANQAPIANAGGDISVTLPLRLLTLDGSKSFDPDGIITSFNWRQISGPSEITIGSPDAAVTNLFKLSPGEFIFELVVTDDKGLTGSDSVTVNILQREQPQKVCSPLDGIIFEFKKLPEIQPTLFPIFVQNFQSYSKVEGFFKAVEDVFSKPPTEQISFFAQANVPQLLAEWLDQLFILVLRSDFRAHALALYRILILLAEHVACIQADDIDKATVPLNNVFQIIIKHMNAMKQASANFPPDLLARLIEILNDSIEEEKRIHSNSEQTAKPIYLRLIQALLELLKPLTA